MADTPPMKEGLQRDMYSKFIHVARKPSDIKNQIKILRPKGCFLSVFRFNDTWQLGRNVLIQSV